MHNSIRSFSLRARIILIQNAHVVVVHHAQTGALVDVAAGVQISRPRRPSDPARFTAKRAIAAAPAPAAPTHPVGARSSHLRMAPRAPRDKTTARPSQWLSGTAMGGDGGEEADHHPVSVALRRPFCFQRSIKIKYRQRRSHQRRRPSEAPTRSITRRNKGGACYFAPRALFFCFKTLAVQGEIVVCGK